MINKQLAGGGLTFPNYVAQPVRPVRVYGSRRRLRRAPEIEGGTYGTGDSGVIVVSNRRSEITRRSRSVYSAARLWVRSRRIKWRQRTVMARTQGARVTASVPPCRTARRDFVRWCDYVI